MQYKEGTFSFVSSILSFFLCLYIHIVTTLSAFLNSSLHSSSPSYPPSSSFSPLPPPPLPPPPPPLLLLSGSSVMGAVRMTVLEKGSKTQQREASMKLLNHSRLSGNIQRTAPSDPQLLPCCLCVRVVVVGGGET